MPFFLAFSLLAEGFFLSLEGAWLSVELFPFPSCLLSFPFSRRKSPTEVFFNTLS